MYFQYQLFLHVFLVPIHHTSISTIWFKHWRSLHLEWKQVLCGNTSKIIREKKIQQYSYAIFLLTWHFTFLEGTRFLFHTNQRFLSLHDSHHIMNELIVLKKIKQCSFFFLDKNTYSHYPILGCSRRQVSGSTSNHNGRNSHPALTSQEAFYYLNVWPPEDFLVSSFLI